MNWRKVAAGFTAALLSVTTASIFPTKTVFAADVCVIDTDTEYQTIRGFGGTNHPEWAGDLTQAQRQIPCPFRMIDSGMGRGSDAGTAADGIWKRRE